MPKEQITTLTGRDESRDAVPVVVSVVVPVVVARVHPRHGDPNATSLCLVQRRRRPVTSTRARVDQFPILQRPQRHPPLSTPHR